MTFLKAKIHCIALATAIIFTAFSQVFLKRGASNRPTFIASFLNRQTIIGFGLFGIVTVLNVYAMQKIELKIVTAWTGVSYILVVFFSGLILNEKIDSIKVISCILIISGIIIFNLGNVR